MTNAKDAKIKDLQSYIAGYNSVILSCIELLQALETHTGKMVDKRFFEKHFTIKNEYHNYTKYSYVGKQYNFDTYNYSIYLGTSSNGEKLKLQTRETSELVNALKERHQTAFAMVEKYTSEIEKLTAFDENAMVQDIIAIYHRYGKPDIWGSVLSSYDVKYPS